MLFLYSVEPLLIIWKLYIFDVCIQFHISKNKFLIMYDLLFFLLIDLSFLLLVIGNFWGFSTLFLGWLGSSPSPKFSIQDLWFSCITIWGFYLGVLLRWEWLWDFVFLSFITLSFHWYPWFMLKIVSIYPTDTYS
jgi:hypothetical protein